MPEAMATVSFWQRQHLGADVACDVAIVGAGIVGASTAFWLSRLDPRARIALIDAGAPAAGASGRNAGFVLQGVTSDYATDRQRYGEERARRLWHFTRENRDLIARHLDARTIGLETSGSLVVAGTPEEDARLEQSVQMLRADGTAASYLPPREVERRIGSRGLGGGVYATTGAVLDPVALVQALVAQSGAQVLAGHRVAGIALSGSRLIVETSARRVFAGRVVVAAGAWAGQVAPELGAFVRPVRAQMLATAPLGPRRLTLPVYTHGGFFYLRQTPGGHLLLGGARHLHERAETGYDDAATPGVQQSLETFLHTHFPFARAASVVQRWSGLMGFSPDGLPVAGQLAGLDEAYFATGFTGHGMGYGFRFGKMMAEWIDGDPAPTGLDLFAASRLAGVAVG